MSEELFLCLDYLFAEADACTADPELLQNESYNTEQQLRVIAQRVYDEVQGEKLI